MFEILPASAAGREATTGHALVSITAHAGLIVAAALLTSQVAGTPSVRAPVEPLVYIPIPIRIDASAPMPPSLGATDGLAPPGPVEAMIPAPIEVPVGAAGTPGLPPSGATSVGASPTSGSVSGWLSGPGPSGAWRAADVDDPVSVLEAGRLVFPPVLERAGITGSVVLEFVVDTLGRVEASSLKVISASHPGFEAAALEAALETRYRAARAGGAPVRQLVRQKMGFVGRTAGR